MDFYKWKDNMKRLVEFDIVYISYDEPNAEEHWAHLQSNIPWAQRVHGVKGFDAAHKEAANIATSDRFITVDGDNKIIPEILNFEVDVAGLAENTVLSFSSRNNINGLIYGNGGLKLWPKLFVQEMKTHEVSEGEDAKVDFCWFANYKQYDKLSSHNYQNGSAFQAFRAGFREGVKMVLDQGLRIRADEVLEKLDSGNIKRLLVWCSVGRDIEHGEMAIYGARLGAFKTLCTAWDFAAIRDYDWFNEYWLSENWIEREKTDDEPLRKLKEEVGLTLAELGPEQSTFFKNVYINPSRTRFE